MYCVLTHTSIYHNIHVLDSEKGRDMTDKETERELTRHQTQIQLLLQYVVCINNKVYFKLLTGNLIDLGTLL